MKDTISFAFVFIQKRPDDLAKTCQNKAPRHKSDRTGALTCALVSSSDRKSAVSFQALERS